MSDWVFAKDLMYFYVLRIYASKDTGLDILEESRTIDMLPVYSAVASVISFLGTFFLQFLYNYLSAIIQVK